MWQVGQKCILDRRAPRESGLLSWQPLALQAWVQFSGKMWGDILMWNQRCLEVCWCSRQLIDCMLLYQILVLSSGVWWLLLLHVRCLWHHNMTSYPCFQTNNFSQFVDRICILFYSHPYRCCTMCHCIECKLSGLQVKRPQQNTTLCQSSA